MSATTLLGCSRRCHSLDISLSELSYRSLYDGFMMELLPFMGKQATEFTFGCFLEVRHGVYYGVEVKYVFRSISVHLSELVFVESMEGKVPLLESELYRRFKEVR